MLGTSSSSPSVGRSRRGTRRARRLLAAVAVVGALTAVGAGPSAAQEAPQPRESTSPFTGLPADPAPVLAVKMDNHKGARPQTAVEDADIVVVEKVEGGLSRLLGIYSSKLPESLGPVRSAREYNVEQLRTFGRPALSYSGAREGVEDLIEKSTLYARSHDKYPDAYFRGGNNEAPHNLYVHPDQILDSAPDASLSKDIGFRFGDKPAGGVPTDERSVNYGSAETTVKWSDEEQRWLTSFDGAPAQSTGGKQLGGKTVVIQKTDMPPDSSGTTPYINTVGTGEATVLRDGEAFETTWNRPDADAGTTYTLPDGKPMPFDRGQVWVVYEER